MAYDPKTYWQKRQNPNVKGSNKAPQFMYDFIKPLLVNKSNVLELGPGTGRILDMYSTGTQVSTVDLSRSYQDQVATRAKELNLSVKQHHLATPDDTFPFEDNTFDLGISLQVLMHIPPAHIKTSLRELHRTCKSVAIIATNPEAKDSLADHVFGHDYRKLCADMGATMDSYEVYRSSVCFTFS